MPLAPLFSLQWYGPGLGAAVDTSAPSANATIRGLGHMAATHTTAPTAYARPNDGRQLRAVHTTAPTAYARPAGRGRIAAVGKVNELTQDDVTGALLTSKIEGDWSFRDVMRLLVAAAAGQSDKAALGGGATQHTYRDLDDTKDRIVASVNAAGERTAITRDVS